MIVACPDHYIIAREADGRQLVIETTGGSPTAAEFWVDYTDIPASEPCPTRPTPFRSLVRHGLLTESSSAACGISSGRKAEAFARC